MGKISFLLTPLVVLLLSGCVLPPSSRITAETYLSALIQQDFRKAQELSTDELVSPLNLVNLIEKTSQIPIPAGRSQLGFEIIGIAETGDIATVTYTFTGQKPATFRMKKVINEWKVDYSIEELLEQES